MILHRDNPSGLPENADQVKIPVLFESTASQETIKVKAYFNNSKLVEDITSDSYCKHVFPVEREIPKTLGVARAALEELLKGPTKAEKTEGYFTSIISGVEIQGIAIENEIAKVDFNDELDRAGGSCRVALIFAQITQTIKQFPTVKNVIISVNGRTEDILQP